MPTADRLIDAFEFLTAAGHPRPREYDQPARLKQIISTWLVVLHELDDDDLLAATIAYTRSGSSFWPTAGQILAMSPTTQEESADEWWGWLIAYAARHGYSAGAPMEQLPPPAKAGVDAVGWEAICSGQTDATRAAFRTAFRASKARERTTQAVALARQIEVGRTLMIEAEPG